MSGTVLLYAFFAYLCGSIPFGLIFTRAAGLGDIRDIGSGNIGATNVLRTGNRKVAALTLVCDAIKGLFPVGVAAFNGPEYASFAAGLAALAGHVFPVWLGFKGGKGVATSLGVLLGWSWMIALAGIVVWAIIFAVTRISSLSAITACVLTVPATFVLRQLGFTDIPVWPVAIVAAVVLVTHHQNIKRLLRGEEGTSKISRP